MYENRHGRFTAVDPLLASGKSANPQTFNRYTYVLNSPLVNTDPTGLQTNYEPCKSDERCDATLLRDKKTGKPVAVKPDGPIETVQCADCGQEGTLPPNEPNPIIAPFLKSFSDAADDKIYGMGKGTYNFAAGIWNTETTRGGLIGGLLGVENPFSVDYYQYSNAREAGWSVATQSGWTIGTVIPPGAFSGGVSRTPLGLSSMGEATVGAGTLPRSSLEFTNRLSGNSLKRLGPDIAANGIKEPINIASVNGRNFVVDGNHRLALAYKHGIFELPVQRVSLPFRGFKNEQSVMNSGIDRNVILNSSAFRHYRR